MISVVKTWSSQETSLLLFAAFNVHHISLVKDHPQTIDNPYSVIPTRANSLPSLVHAKLFLKEIHDSRKMHSIQTAQKVLWKHIKKTKEKHKFKFILC